MKRGALRYTPVFFEDSAKDFISILKENGFYGLKKDALRQMSRKGRKPTGLLVLRIKTYVGELRKQIQGIGE